MITRQRDCGRLFAMYDYEDDGLDKKTRKRFYRVVRNAASAVGGGLGLILMKGFFTTEVPKATSLFNGLGLWLIAYGVIILLVAAFRRDAVFNVNNILMFMVTPIVVLKLILAAA